MNGLEKDANQYLFSGSQVPFIPHLADANLFPLLSAGELVTYVESLLQFHWHLIKGLWFL